MIRFKPAGEWLRDARLAAKVRRLVDEDRVDFAPFDYPYTFRRVPPMPLAYRARVRSTSGQSHDVFFDSEGGACSCRAAATGHLCSHLAAAMVRWHEMTGTPPAPDGLPPARASRMHGHD